jgi:hypothetical protein
MIFFLFHDNLLMISAIHYRITNLTGVIALLLETDPSLSSSEILSILQETARADDFTGIVPNVSWGYGKLDALAAVELALGIVSTNSEIISIKVDMSISPNPIEETLEVSFPLSYSEVLSADIFSIDGKKVKSFKLSETITLNLNGIPSGIYVFSVKA